MELLLPLIILGLISYYIVQRSITDTKTPVWLCWLVIMMPAFIWSGWSVFVGDDKPIPLLLAIGPFIVCPLLYWWLIQQGRIQASIESKVSQPENLEPKNLDSESNLNLSSLRPITPGEETILRNCFPFNVYYLQHLDYRPQAILCRGKLRTVPKAAYETIKENIETAFGDRFCLIFQESFQGQPFFALVPNPWSKSSANGVLEERLSKPGIALILLGISLITATMVGAVEFSHIALSQLESNPALFLKGLPYGLALVAILGVHELGHYLTMGYYKIRSTLPYFIPEPFFIGTFGAFTQRRSPVPHRQALFDIAIAGPIAGLLLMLPLLFWGLSVSEIVPISAKANLLTFDRLNPRFSLLLAVLSKLALGDGFTSGMAIDLHPLAIAGYIGLLITALNLMPVGQLDGGQIVHAMYGQQTAVAVSQVTRLLTILFFLANRSFLFWTILVWLMPIINQPALNDVTELDNRRDLLGFLSLVVLIAIVLPLPEAIANWMNI